MCMFCKNQNAYLDGKSVPLQFYVHLVKHATIVTRAKKIYLFKNSNTYKDQNIETERVWLEWPGRELRKIQSFLNLNTGYSSQTLARFPCFGL